MFEHFVHASLSPSPLAAPAIVAALHWPAWRALFPPFDAAAAGGWALRWREPPFAPATLAAVLGASFVFGVIPGAIEFLRTVAARRRGEAPPAA